ncbi:MAG: hypothetical protein NC318_14830 [Blautia sp.]|nr:hypothetical protein [Lachnoclostridium sp.]MCM1212858.1 hypothetical protein [Blautia sp.]
MKLESGTISLIVIVYLVEAFWLVGQGLVVPIAISALVTLLMVNIVQALIKAKGDDAMENKLINFVNMGLNILYTMSVNLAGGALLAKVLQSKKLL